MQHVNATEIYHIISYDKGALPCAFPSGYLSNDDIEVVLEDGVAKYSCKNKTHYEIDGPKTKTCNESNGIWTPKESPRCVLVCISPISNSTYRSNESFYLDATNCKYSFSGYGKSRRKQTEEYICQNGTWNKPIPKPCDCNVCTAPRRQMMNAQLIRVSSKCIRNRTKAYYACTTAGLGAIQVCLNGEWRWKSSPPQCTNISCNANDLPPGVVMRSKTPTGYDITNFVFNKGATVKLECQERKFIIRGSKRALCTKRGWKYVRKPQCKPKRNKSDRQAVTEKKTTS
ncbi:E-selectin-like isoform X2 [Corticium candelabrum]|uniref:E-selectin-like isoform X2 n=1 Tax=Corticium candelabrum TaxID=121492 RepID=UPI002E26066A|nr:E-selectin-like isoform X2 [Corticium candelabrum]